MFGDLIDPAGSEITRNPWFVPRDGQNWLMATDGLILLAYEKNAPHMKSFRTNDCITAPQQGAAFRVMDAAAKNKVEDTTKVNLDLLYSWVGAYVPPLISPCPSCIGGVNVCPECNGFKGHVCTCKECGAAHIVVCEKCRGKGILGQCTSCDGTGRTVTQVERPAILLNVVVNTNLVAKLLHAISSDGVQLSNGTLKASRGAAGSHFREAVFFNAEHVFGMVMGAVDMDKTHLRVWEPDKSGFGTTMLKLDLD